MKITREILKEQRDLTASFSPSFLDEIHRLATKLAGYGREVYPGTVSEYAISLWDLAINETPKDELYRVDVLEYILDDIKNKDVDYEWVTIPGTKMRVLVLGSIRTD